MIFDMKRRYVEMQRCGTGIGAEKCICPDGWGWQCGPFQREEHPYLDASSPKAELCWSQRDKSSFLLMDTGECFHPSVKSAAGHGGRAGGWVLSESCILF